jgi:hypothetical protein
VDYYLDLLIFQMETTSLYVGKREPKGFTVSKTPNEILSLVRSGEPQSCVATVTLDYTPTANITETGLHVLNSDRLDKLCLEAAIKFLVNNGTLYTPLDISLVGALAQELTELAPGYYIKSKHKPAVVILPRITEFEDLKIYKYDVAVLNYKTKHDCPLSAYKGRGETVKLKGPVLEVHSWYAAFNLSTDPALNYTSLQKMLTIDKWQDLGLVGDTQLCALTGKYLKNKALMTTSYPHNYQPEQLYYTLEVGSTVLDSEDDELEVVEVKYPSPYESPVLVME